VMTAVAQAVQPVSAGYSPRYWIATVAGCSTAAELFAP